MHKLALSTSQRNRRDGSSQSVIPSGIPLQRKYRIGRGKMSTLNCCCCDSVPTLATTGTGASSPAAASSTPSRARALLMTQLNSPRPLGTGTFDGQTFPVAGFGPKFTTLLHCHCHSPKPSPSSRLGAQKQPDSVSVPESLP